MVNFTGRYFSEDTCESIRGVFHECNRYVERLCLLSPHLLLRGVQERGLLKGISQLGKYPGRSESLDAARQAQAAR